MSDFDIKQMPHSYEAEMAVLGAIIYDESLMSEVAFLTADDFYLEQHKAVYSALLQMYASSRSIDAVTLVDTIVKSGTYSEGDASKYIKTLVDSAIVTSNIKDYADIVRSKSLLRSIINIAQDMADKAYSERESVNDLVDSCEQMIYDIAKGDQSEALKPISDEVTKEYDRLEQLNHNPEAFSGIKTGFSELDKYLVGMNPGDLIVVGARPGMGKTSLCLNIAANVAKATKKEVVIFSLEMPAGQLVSRMLSSESGVEHYNMRTGNINNEEWQRLAEACSALSETNILIDDTSTITLTQIKSKLRRCKNLGLVIIDYLQLMTASKSGDRAYENRVNEVAALTRGLKLMAKDIGAPVIICSQLNRSMDQRNDKKPQLSDLRESGSIEQDADSVLLLYKYIPPKKSTDKDQPQPEVQETSFVHAVCEVAKNRHGSTAPIHMNWHGSTYRFSVISTFYDEN